MNILSLDSTAKTASVALLCDDTPLAEYNVTGGERPHSELLLPMVKSLLSSVSLTIDDIDLFACTVGPGSFTGVRIGTALLKGLAFDSGKPCVGVAATEALAEGVSPCEGYILPMMDARRGEVYTALFCREGDTLSRLTPDRALPAALLAEELKRDYPTAAFCPLGDGAALGTAALSAAGMAVVTPPSLLLYPHAAAVGKCALRAYRSGSYESDEALRPFYLRLPQAERERLERLKKENS